jgi:hypothetical protein
MAKHYDMALSLILGVVPTPPNTVVRVVPRLGIRFGSLRNFSPIGSTRRLNSNKTSKHKRGTNRDFLYSKWVAKYRQGGKSCSRFMYFLAAQPELYRSL